MKLNLEELKLNGEAAEWHTDESIKTLENGYLLDGETPRAMYNRIARAVASRLNKPELEQKFFDYMWKGWLGPASPVCANMGTERGLPISCYSVHVGDSVNDIMGSMGELAALSKHGGGVGMHWNDVRSRGSEISNGNGKSDGVIPFLKIQDSTTIGISQGGVRRGASAAYLPVDHGDVEEFLKMRRPQGDTNRQCLNIHHGINISDSFMNRVIDKKDKEARSLWVEIMKTRYETGEPYLFFSDNVEKNRPEVYKKLGLDVKGSNICTEIFLHTDKDHSFVCCLSSLNLAKYDEWKDTDVMYYSTWFLDGVMQEFIEKAKSKPGFERAVRFAEKSRALGLGVLGFHTLLQKRMLPYDHFDTFMLNAEIFRNLDRETKRASEDLAKEYGEPEWCKGFGVRNTHRVALAPTVSNSIISGNVSPSIEPWTANSFAKKSAKGTFIHRNKELEVILEAKGKNTESVWASIVGNQGSVQHLDFLTKQEKDVFLTAREINQFVLIKLAGQRQRWIDQGQSINLFFPSNVDPKYFHDVHVMAWKEGLNTLYYCRTSSPLKGDAGSREYDRKTIDTQAEAVVDNTPYSRSASECVACEG
ncbi:ribonucleoside-diphosphate reductase subunit alpha [bacterium]|nr:ribonucleoside-diphosphate reductase subunit alpha [bacterium]